MIDLIYFSWIRERIGKSSESIETGASTVIELIEELKKKGELNEIGGPSFITKMTERIASAANIETHSRIITQKFIQRELIRISSQTIKDAYDDTTDVFDLLNSAEQGLYAISEGNIRKNYDKMSTLILQALKFSFTSSRNTSSHFLCN